MEQIISLAVALVGAVLTYLVWPYFREKTKIHQNQNIQFLVKMAVIAAEKYYNEQGQGASKKEFVMGYLLEMNLPIDEETLSILIDAIVEELFNSQEG